MSVVCRGWKSPVLFGALLGQIKSLQRKTAGSEGFKALLEATSTLRREQEVETKLQERMHEQRGLLIAAERRLVDTQRRLSELRSTERVCVGERAAPWWESRVTSLTSVWARPWVWVCLRGRL